MSEITYDESLIDNRRETVRPQEIDKSDSEKKHRIKIWMAVCLMMVALLVDLLQFLLTGVLVGVVIAPIISVGATFGFWVWFKLLDVSYVAKPGKLATMAVQSFAEVIPGLDALPLLSLGIFIIIVMTRMEDSGGALGKVAGMAQGEVSRMSKGI
jgi:hypothetical protein